MTDLKRETFAEVSTCCPGVRARHRERTGSYFYLRRTECDGYLLRTLGRIRVVALVPQILLDRHPDILQRFIFRFSLRATARQTGAENSPPFLGFDQGDLILHAERVVIRNTLVKEPCETSSLFPTLAVGEN
jgi:hypothetical protein